MAKPTLWPIVKLSPKPKTQKFDLSELKPAGSQTQNILHESRNREERPRLSSDRFAPSLASRTPACRNGQPRAGPIASPHTRDRILRR